MSVNSNDLTIPDVFDDVTKNLCNLYIDSEESSDIPNVIDSLYYTEEDYVNLISDKKISNQYNLTIITINIANLLSKLKFLKIFLNNITTNKKQPDIIVVVETHISETVNAGYNAKELQNIIPVYNFFLKGRTSKKGGGVGIFVSHELDSDTQVLDLVRFREEKFENHNQNP